MKLFEDLFDVTQMGICSLLTLPKAETLSYFSKKTVCVWIATDMLVTGNIPTAVPGHSFLTKVQMVKAAKRKTYLDTLYDIFSLKGY